MRLHSKLASYIGSLVFLTVWVCPCIHAQDGVIVPSAKCVTPSLSFISANDSGIRANIGDPAQEIFIPANTDTKLTIYTGPNLTLNSALFHAKAAALYHDGRLVVTISCSAPETVPKQGGGTIPVIYRFDDASGEKVRTPLESKKADDTLLTNLTAAVRRAVTEGRLTNDQIQSAVDRVQSQLHAKLESALVDDVSRKLGATNLLESLARLEKQVAELQDQMTKLQRAAQPPPQPPAQAAPKP